MPGPIFRRREACLGAIGGVASEIEMSGVGGKSGVGRPELSMRTSNK